MTEHEIECFADFARRKLDNGGVDSLEECLREWRDAETVAAIQRGIEQANAGQTRPFHEFDADIQQKYGFAVEE